MFVLIHHLASEQHICVQQTSFELLQCERVGLVTNAFETNDSVAAYAVDEVENAGQDLDFELYDEERGIFDVDAEEAGIEMFRCQCLEAESIVRVERVEDRRERTASFWSMILQRLKSGFMKWTTHNFAEVVMSMSCFSSLISVYVP